jgi:hypothetical protein
MVLDSQPGTNKWGPNPKGINKNYNDRYDNYNDQRGGYDNNGYRSDEQRY